MQNDEKYEFLKADLKNRKIIDKVFRKFQPDKVLHLAAETHVDHSIMNPRDFVEANILGTFNVLEAAKNYWYEQENLRILDFIMCQQMKFLGH